MSECGELAEEGTNGLKLGRLRQTFASLIASCIILNAGMVSGWISPMSLVLTGKDSPVGVLTEDEISILAALPNLATLFFIPIIGFVINRYGRKIGIQLLGLLSATSSIILTFSTSKTALYSGMLMSGIIGSGAIVPYSYVTEISEDSIRGILASSCVLQFVAGILMSSIVGNELTYKNYNATLILVPVIFFSLSFCVPESPFFLFDQSRKEDAFKSLLWLRGNNQKSVQDAIQSMELAHANRVPETSFKSIFTSPGLRRATLIGLFLFSCQIFSGYSIIFCYDEIIFQKIGSPMSVGYSSIVVSSVTLVSSFFGVITVDICGRKPLLYTGFSVGFISMSILSIYLFMTNEGWDEGNWVPFACMIVFVFGYGLGTNLIPQLTTTEIVPSHMRPKILGMLMIVYSILVAIVLQSFPLLDESVGLYGVFLLSSIVNLVGIVGTWYVVPETKSKSHVAMANDLNR